MTTAAPSDDREFFAFNWNAHEVGILQGFFSLRLPSGLILHNCTLFRNQAGGRWIGLPSQKIIRKDGGATYKPLVEFSSREAADKFRDLALEAVDAMRSSR
jgi:hypothetical protein